MNNGPLVPKTAKKRMPGFFRPPSWVIALVLVALLVAPLPSHGQFGLFGLIAGAISDVIGGGLDALTGIMRSIEEFERTVVWPEDLIDEARGVVGRRVSGSPKPAIGSRTRPNRPLRDPPLS